MRFPDGRCKGEYVATVIRLVGNQLADRELARRYAPPDGVIPLPEPSAFVPPLPDGETGPGNLVIGTQTFAAAYQFTRQSRLLETASAIGDMGATVIKFQLSKRYAGETGNVPAADPAIRSLTDLVRDEPSHRQRAGYAVSSISCSGRTVSVGDPLPSWRGGFSEDEANSEYREIRELTTYLLQNLQRQREDLLPGALGRRRLAAPQHRPGERLPRHPRGGQGIHGLAEHTATGRG